MSEWTRLGPESALPREGEAKEFATGGRVLCVARVHGELCAVDNECPHRGGPLAEGFIEEGKIVCPWHGWAFDPKTGAATHNPNARVRVYPIKTEAGDVYVTL
jgi:nitrite reductase (NADH) small subunit